MKYYHISLLMLIILFVLELLLLCVYYVDSTNVGLRDVTLCSQGFAQNLTNWDLVSGILIIMMQSQIVGAMCIFYYYYLKHRYEIRRNKNEWN